MKTKFKRIGRQSLSIVLAVMMMVSTMLVGMVTSNASGTYTIYFTPEDSWTTVKVNCKLQSDVDKWQNFTATDTNKTISSKKVYKADLVLPYDGVYKMEFNNGSTYNAVINNTWTNASEFSGKYWNGSSWVDPDWDSSQTTTYYVAGNTGLVGGSNGWETGDYNKMEYNSSTGIYSKTFNNVAKGTYQFKFTDGTNWKGGSNFTMTPSGCIADNGFTFTNDNFQIVTTQEANITITYDGDKTVTVNAVSSTQDTTVAPDTTVPSTTAPSGGEGTATTYKLMVAQNDGGVGDDATGTSSTNSPTVYELSDGTLSVKVPAGRFTEGNNFFALSSTGKNNGIVSTSNVTVESSLKSIITSSGVQGWNPNSFVRISCNSGISNVDVNVTYKDGTYTISPVAAPVTKYKVNVTSSNATVKINDATVESGSSAQVAENTDFTLKVTPATGYYITSITVAGKSKTITDKKGENTYSVPMGTADIAVNVQTAQIVKPTVELAGANEVYFGNSVPLTPTITNESEFGDVTITDRKYTVSPTTSPEATVTDNNFTVPKELGVSNDTKEYTVTYTVTLSNGETGSAEKIITAKNSAEQKAYKALLAGLGTSTYPDPSTYTGKTAATVADYKTAYDAAVAVKKAGYPDAGGTANKNAQSALVDAQSKLVNKTSLPKPVLAVQEGNSVKAGSSINLYISNESSYPEAANVTFEIYNADTSSKITTISKGQKANILNVAVGENKYYAKAVLGNTDDYSLTTAQSDTITVTGVEMVTVTVSAVGNGNAYISEYTDVTGTVKTNTNTTLLSVAVTKGTDVTFTAEPNSGFQVASWNGTASTDTTYTTTVSSDTTVSVTFEETPLVEVALLGKTITIDTTSTSNQFTDGLTFVNNQAIIEVSGDSNWFGFVDSNGNYYNVSTNTKVSSGNTYTVNKVDNAPASGCVSWISASTSTFYKLTITEFIPGTSLTYSLEQISTPWRIYGDSTYFPSYGWTSPSSGALITLSYKGNANQYYYPLEMTAGSTAYFGFYYNGKTHQPKDNNVALPTATGTSIYANDGTGNTAKSYTITADTAGTYYICIDTSNSRIWYEKEATEPVPVTLTLYSSVSGGKVSISSYFNNDTGSIVNNPSETTVNAKPGTNVTFKADAVDGYYVKWTTSLDSSVATGDTFTLTNVTGTDEIIVYATYVQIVNYDVTVKAQEGGTVTATLNGVSQDVSKAISVASNGEITLEANPDTSNKYVFKGWEVNSTDYTIKSGTLSTQKITVTPLGNVTFTAKFEVQQGEVSTQYNLMYSTSDQTLIGDSDGDTVKTGLTFYKYEDDKYKVTVPIGSLNKLGNNYLAFTTGTGTSALTGMVARAGTKPKIGVDETSRSYFSNPEIKERYGSVAGDTDNRYYFVYFGFKSDVEVESVTIVYDVSENKYTLSADANILENQVYLYAAKGTEGGNQFANSVEIIEGVTDGYYQSSSSGNYTKLRAKQGDKVTVKYTMNTDYAKAGYYIYALVVDGKKVDVTKSADGVYQSAPIALTKEKTEVTPVYYNSVIDANNDYITVYATAPKAINDLWGNTLAIYTWFSSDDNNPKRGDGSYPGQPMMQESNGKYVAKVAKYYYSYNSTTKTVEKDNAATGGTLIKGLLLNNFAEKQSSRQLHFLTTTAQKTNNQSYDYDDFVKIAAMGYDTVQFDIKYEGVTSTNQKVVIDNSISAPDKTSSDTAPTPATTYEDLTNIDGKLVSILGYDDETIRTKQGENATGLITSKSIKIISVGNQNIYVKDDGTWSTTSSTGATQNKWSTIWYVYDTNGKFVTRGLPSDFIPRGEVVDGEFVEAVPEQQTAAYRDIVKAELQYTSADISYETRMKADTSTENKNSGVRVDGRWYYARSADQVDVEVGIIYKNSGGSYTTDIPENDIIKAPFTGKITGASASISYTDSVGGEHSQIAKDSVERNTTVKFIADNSTTYEFIGWSTVPNPTDADISKDTNAISINTATKLYAVYKPYANGTLVLNHSKYNGSGANGGVGTYYIKAEVYNSSSILVKTFGSSSTEGPITIPADYIAENSTYKIKVTLYTKPSANSTFVSFYGYKDNDFSKVIGSTTNNGTGALFESETYEIDPAKLFTSGTQTVMAVNYYTDLKLPVLASEITFNYKPYSQAPVLSETDPVKGKGTGTTTFTVTITDKAGNDVTPDSIKNKETSSLILSASSNIKDIIDAYINDNSGTVDYTITITLTPKVAGTHSYIGKTYLQGTDSYVKKSDGSESITVTHKLSELYDKSNGGKFKSDTVNYYTDFTADAYTFNATFEYLGYDSRKYFDENGYGTSLSQTEENAYKKTYTVNKTIIGADIDRYLTKDVQDKYILTNQFLIDYAPYEDNFVQTIKWDLENATVSFSNSTVTAKIAATYDTPKFTVTVKYPDNYTVTPADSYTVDYAELVTNPNTEEFLIKALNSYDDNGTTKYFNYWKITNVHDQEVAKCYNTEFNYRVYDNYTITAVYSTDKSASSRPDDERYTTIQFLEYSRNQFDKDGGTVDKSDKVYADFAIAYYYDRLQLKNDTSNLEVGVVFAIDRTTSSAKPESDVNNVTVETIRAYINGNTTSVPDNQSIIKKTFDKTALDNKNRVEFSWNISNTENNQKLNLVAYSYIKTDTGVILSDPQQFKFYDVGNKTYNTTTNS